ncbi:histidine kinase [Streptomyces sp. NPDC097619]|uniref:sensor histidine kinase n=1 Tax=Streptomyces sp. NPDC097619 TaxID=3157228 RepID=UPI00331769A0
MLLPEGPADPADPGGPDDPNDRDGRAGPDDRARPGTSRPDGSAPGGTAAGERHRPRSGPLRRHAPGLGLAVVLLLSWLADLAASLPRPSPLLLGGEVLIALVALAPLPGNPRTELRAGVAVLLSGSLTAVLAAGGGSWAWGLAESAALLLLLVRTARTGAPGPLALGLALLLGAATATTPFRLGDGGGERTLWCFLLTLAAAGAGGLGWYLRTLDERRARAVREVRDRERLRLARDLHDVVAHHVTGMVVQAQAARTVTGLSRERLDELLLGIETAGNETLDSMHRLVRVLREEEDAAVRAGGLVAGLAGLVSRSAETTGGAPRLAVSAAARAARLDPEVETTVHRVVQEALTNAARYAPGAEVRVSVDTAPGGSGLLVTVTDAGGPGTPAGRGSGFGRRGGFGLVGLRERTEAVGGTFEAGPAPDGGWRVHASLPVRAPA